MLICLFWHIPVDKKKVLKRLSFRRRSCTLIAGTWSTIKESPVFFISLIFQDSFLFFWQDGSIVNILLRWSGTQNYELRLDLANAVSGHREECCLSSRITT
jgi:hypothetical protein